jgi:hypothetical protein
MTSNQQEQYCIHYHDTRKQPEIAGPRVLREKSTIGNAVVDQTNEDVPQGDTQQIKGTHGTFH